MGVLNVDLKELGSSMQVAPALTNNNASPLKIDNKSLMIDPKMKRKMVTIEGNGSREPFRNFQRSQPFVNKSNSGMAMSFPTRSRVDIII